MKNLCFIIFSVFAIKTNAQTISWFGPVTVAGGTTYGNFYPRINLVTGNKPLITWGKSSGEIFSSVWNGSAFATPVQLNPAGVTSYVQFWTGPETATAGDTVYTAWSTTPAGTGKIYMVRSIDAGISFADTVRIDDVDTNFGWIPSIAILPGGNPIVSYMRHDAMYDSVDYVTKKSTDGGLTFLPVVNASAMSPGAVCDCCPSSIVSNGNNVVQIYRNAGSNIRTMYGAFSTNGGNSFPAVNEIDMTGWTSGTCPSSGPSGVIVGDSLIFVWMSKAGGPTRVYIGTVNIYDQQIGINRQIFPTASGTQNYPVIAAKGDTVAVVWEHNSSGVTDISFSYSLNGAAGIGNVVDTLTNSFAGNQTRPDIVFNDRKFHVSYSNTMGTEVKYLEGIIGSGIGIADHNASDPESFNAFFNNGFIECRIQSEIEENFYVRIFDAKGDLVRTEQIKASPGVNKYQINFKDPTGIYNISIIGQQKRSDFKILVIQ